MIWIFLILGVAILGWLAAVGSISKKQNNFVELGDVRGKSKKEIIEKIGSPNSISQIGPEKELLQCQEVNSAGGYHYALLFRDGKCEGFTHQHVS